MAMKFDHIFAGKRVWGLEIQYQALIKNGRTARFKGSKISVSWFVDRPGHALGDG